MTSSRATRNDLLFLAAAAAFFCLWNLGGGSLASWDEAQYAQVAKEIVRSGDWVYLRFLGTDWYVKPPLALWATAAFFKLFGVGEFAARLYSALCGVGTVLTTYVVGRFILDRRSALAGAGVLLSTKYFLDFSRFGNMDIPNLFFLTAAIAFFLRAVRMEGGSGRSDRWFLPFGIALAAGFMTKGPVIVFVFPIIFLFSLWSREWGYWKSPYFWMSVVFAAIFVLPWHAAVYLHNPSAFMKDFIGHHWLERSAQAIEGHVGGLDFYIRKIINKFHPWIVVLPFALFYVVWGAVRGSRGARLLTAWMGVIFAVFTLLVSTKIDWYILPLYPALALTVGAMLGRILPDKAAAFVKLFIVAVLIYYFPSVMIRDANAGIKSIAPSVKLIADDKTDVFLYNFHEQPAAVFYFDRNARYADSPGELDHETRGMDRVVLIVPSEMYEGQKGDFSTRGFSEKHRSQLKRSNLVILTRG